MISAARSKARGTTTGGERSGLGLRATLAAAMALAAMALCLALPAQAHAIDNPFAVQGGTEGADWTYEDDVLTITGRGNYTISMKNDATPTTATIVVHPSDTRGTTLTLDGVHIECDPSAEGTKGAPIFMEGGAGIYLWIAEGSTNTLEASGDNAALSILGSNTNLYIYGDGTLEATGSGGGAGIGSEKGKSLSSQIQIQPQTTAPNGPTITATGGPNGGAGIGAGANSQYGLQKSILISAGTITAEGGGGGDDIGAGKDSPIDDKLVKLNGGKFNMADLSVRPANTVITGGHFKGKYDVVQNAVEVSNGTWIPVGNVGAKGKPCIVRGSDIEGYKTLVELGNPYSLAVDGGTYGTDYEYVYDADGSGCEMKVYRTSAKIVPAYPASGLGKNAAKQTTRIVVAPKDNVEVNMTLADVTVDCAAATADSGNPPIANSHPALEVTNGTLNLLLADDTENTLKTSRGPAALQTNGHPLTISGASLGADGTGKLIADSCCPDQPTPTNKNPKPVNRSGAAGIGGAQGQAVSNITIYGGVISARGSSTTTTTGASYGGAGIGCGANGSVDGITIKGGTVTAQGGSNEAGNHGACIGGGYGSTKVDKVVITGGTVTAGQIDAYPVSGDAIPGIGAGSGAAEGVGTNISIEGGDFTASDKFNLFVEPNGISIIGGNFSDAKGTGADVAKNAISGVPVGTEKDVRRIKKTAGSSFPYQVVTGPPCAIVVTGANGEQLVYGDDFTYKGGSGDEPYETLKLLKGSAKFSMLKENATTTTRIEVPAGESNTFTLDGVNINCESSGKPAFSLTGDKPTLTLANASSLTSGSGCAGLQLAVKGLAVSGDGSLKAKGGTDAAGVGSGTGTPFKGDLAFTGGAITATPGYAGGFGIGAGSGGVDESTVTVDGSKLTAEGGASPLDSKRADKITIKSGSFGKGDVATNTVYGLTPAKEHRVVVNRGEDKVTFPVRVIPPATLELKSDVSKTYDGKPFSANDIIGKASWGTQIIHDGAGMTFSYCASGSQDTPTAGLPSDAGTWEITATVPDGPASGEPNYASVTRTATATINQRELGGDLKAALPDITMGTTQADNMEIELSGGNIVEGDKVQAVASVDYPKGATAGTYDDATVTVISLKDTPNYKLPESDLTLTGQHYVVSGRVPTLDDFDVTLPKNPEYNGQPQVATATVKSGITGMGEATVLYTKDGVASPTAPIDAGTYAVTLDVIESATFAAATLDAGTFTIAPRKLDSSVKAVLPDVPAGTGDTADTSITLSGGTILAADAPLTATATITHPSGGIPGAHSDATVSQVALSNTNYTAPEGYTLSGQSYQVLDKQVPAIDNFDIVLPQSIVYDGQPHAATAATKSGVTGMGKVTVRYTKDGATSTTVPADAGTYTVSLVVDEGATYAAATLDAGTFTISPRILDASVKASLGIISVGTSQTTGTSITLSGGIIIAGQQVHAVASAVAYPSNGAVGTYSDATVVLASLVDTPNYTLPAGGLTLIDQAYEVTDKIIPTIADFDVPTVNVEYDGQAHATSIAPHAGIGAVENMRYLKGGAPVSGDPVDAGSYTLMFDVKGTDTCAAVKDLMVPNAVTITPRILDAATTAALTDVQQGTLETQNVTVTLSGGRILEGSTLSAAASAISYPSGGLPGKHTDATVTLTSLVDAPNYALPAGGLTLAGQAYNVVAGAYTIIEGANGSWDGGSQTGLLFRANGELDKFTGVWVDGGQVDSTNYTTKSGSTIVTLKPAYLATLEAGTHTLSVMFTDGVAETTFTIKANPAPKPQPLPQPEPGSNPNSGTSGGGTSLAPTGDVAGATALAFGGAALCALACALLARRKRS